MINILVWVMSSCEATFCFRSIYYLNRRWGLFVGLWFVMMLCLWLGIIFWYENIKSIFTICAFLLCTFRFFFIPAESFIIHNKWLQITWFIYYFIDEIILYSSKINKNLLSARFIYESYDDYSSIYSLFKSSACLIMLC